MTEFVRVRQAEGPKHEFDISVPELESNPDLYVVIDDERVTVTRDVTYEGDVAKPAGRKSTAAKKTTAGNSTPTEAAAADKALDSTQTPDGHSADGQ